jgi:hypothetical protein
VKGSVGGSGASTYVGDGSGSKDSSNETTAAETAAQPPARASSTQAQVQNTGTPPNPLSVAKLEESGEWNAAMEKILAEHPGLTKDELYRTIQRESGFDPSIQNGFGSGATGFFQFMPATAKGLGVTTEEIKNMSPAQQLELYSKYLSQNNYKGGPLGIMQAAPAYASRAGSTVVYGVGSKAWEQNPVWRTAGNGPITVDSINAYYAKK